MVYNATMPIGRFSLAASIFNVETQPQIGYALGGYVFSKVGLFVCMQYYSGSYKQIAIKFNGTVLDGNRKNSLYFGGDLSLLKMP